MFLKLFFIYGFVWMVGFLKLVFIEKCKNKKIFVNLWNAIKKLVSTDFFRLLHISLWGFCISLLVLLLSFYLILLKKDVKTFLPLMTHGFSPLWRVRINITLDTCGADD